MPANCTIIKESSDLVSLSWALPLTNCAVYTYNVSWLWEAKWNGSLADEDWDTTGQMSYTISGIRPYSEVLISIKGKTASGYGPALECEALTAEYCKLGRRNGLCNSQSMDCTSAALEYHVAT